MQYGNQRLVILARPLHSDRHSEETMTLTEEQKTTIFQWIQKGAGLPEIQKRLKDEFGITITYLEARLLADDLKLQFIEPPEPPKETVPPEVEPPPLPGKLSLTIDQITKPGAMVSGRVTFSDGEKAAWFLDQAGRLGLDPSTPGYRPGQQDVANFQAELERAARSQGL